MEVDRTKWLAEEDWRRISSVLPIACVDVLPVIRDESGQIVRIGLIWRTGADGIHGVWCHIGGRLLFDESLEEGVARSLREVLVGIHLRHVAPDPFTVMEYFTTRRPGAGFDPRKHAVAPSFLADIGSDADVQVVPGSEAADFRWFDTDNIPREVWPGTELMIAQALNIGPWSNHELTYATLSQREAARDQMMWQTPALAMTAMAFLLTIALGNSGPIWARSMAAALSIVVAVMSMQLMARHSTLSIRDADTLWEIERASGMRPIHEPPIRIRGTQKRSRRLDAFVGFFVRQRSRQVWLFGIGIFAALSLIALIIIVFGWLSSHYAFELPDFPCI